jgi:hypothetical protein
MKRVRAIVILTLVVLLTAGSTAWAVSNAAALFLRVAAGARPGGMGEAFVSIADDATATYWNPAGLGNGPIAEMLKTKLISDQRGRGFGSADGSGSPGAQMAITSAVTMEGLSGRTETWVIAGNELLMYDGEDWRSGTEYGTSADQTLADFLKSIFNSDDENELKTMGAAVVAINCPVSGAEVDSFVAQVTANIPEGYGAQDDLVNGLEAIRTGYSQCLLLAPQFKDLQSKLADGLKDGKLTTEETDRLTYSLERAVSRYLPSQLTVPYNIGIGAKMTCLGAVGHYLWVGTENGLYRLGGQVWARYSMEHGLPSDTITAMASFDEALFIGTDRGLIQYYHGAFTGFPGIPAERVSVIAMKSREDATAIIGGMVYRFDGLTWSDSYAYTVRIDDSLDKLVSRCSIYGTAEEREYLKQRILELNRPMALAPPATDSAASAVIDSAATAAGSTPSATPEAIPPAAAESTVVDQTATPVTDDIGRWLVEGHVIRLPLSPRFRFEVTALAVDLANILWVGTAGGLLSFDGSEWSRYGYTKYVVPAGDSTAPGLAMTADDIAGTFLKGMDSSKVSLLARNIDLYNQLNGGPVPPGGEVYVYSSNLGSAIQSLGLVFGELHVGTEYGLEKRTKDGWEKIKMADLDRQQVVSSGDFQGRSVYVTSDGATIETKGTSEIVLMHAKWLPSLDQDMYYEFVSYVQHLRGIGSVGLNIVFLSYGTIQYMDEYGNPTGEGNPLEFAVTLSYGTSLTSRLKWGLNGKYINSRLSTQGAGKEVGQGIASAFALDMGILYRITERMQFGAAVTNLGPDISYIDKAQSDPLPRNLGVGLSYRILNSTYNRLIVQGELNKLLVNLDHGIGREMEYAIRHIGAEYVYANLISLRAGYKYDKEGQVKHLTFGAGLQLVGARLDFAYIPSSTDSPLANTLRVSLSLRL